MGHFHPFKNDQRRRDEVGEGPFPARSGELALRLGPGRWPLVADEDGDLLVRRQRPSAASPLR